MKRTIENIMKETEDKLVISERFEQILRGILNDNLLIKEDKKEFNCHVCEICNEPKEVPKKRYVVGDYVVYEDEDEIEYIKIHTINIEKWTWDIYYNDFSEEELRKPNELELAFYR